MPFREAVIDSIRKKLIGEAEEQGFLLKELIPYTVPGVPFQRQLVIFKKRTDLSV